jgi:hypothetical protein
VPWGGALWRNRLPVSGADRDRTGDPLLAKQVLSQLSYRPEGATSVQVSRFAGAPQVGRVQSRIRNRVFPRKTPDGKLGKVLLPIHQHPYRSLLHALPGRKKVVTEGGERDLPTA